MTYEHRENTGNLFKNERKQPGENTPDYRGEAMVNGQVVEIAAWIKTSNAGKKFMSLRFQEPRQRSAPPASASPASDEEVPF